MAALDVFERHLFIRTCFGISSSFWFTVSRTFSVLQGNYSAHLNWCGCVANALCMLAPHELSIYMLASGMRLNSTVLYAAFSTCSLSLSWREYFVIGLGMCLRLHIYGVIFFLLCVAERTFQQVSPSAPPPQIEPADGVPCSFCGVSMFTGVVVSPKLSDNLVSDRLWMLRKSCSSGV